MLPPEIGKLTNLKSLILNANQLTELPLEIENLSNLTVLSEIGLPNFFAVKIYLAGIKSRVSATELSGIIASLYSQESLTARCHKSYRYRCHPG
jgi:hypothetical protein